MRCDVEQPVAPAVTQEDAVQEKALRESFKKIAGEDLEVDAYELQGILNAAFMKGKPQSASLMVFFRDARCTQSLD